MISFGANQYLIRLETVSCINDSPRHKSYVGVNYLYVVLFFCFLTSFRKLTAQTGWTLLLIQKWKQKRCEMGRKKRGRGGGGAKAQVFLFFCLLISFRKLTAQSGHKILWKSSGGNTMMTIYIRPRRIGQNWWDWGGGPNDQRIALGSSAALI